MFKLTLTHNTTYSEIPQPNPMRWRIVLRDKKELISQSGLIRCRDFFNDLVAARVAKKAFGIYGFNTKDIKFNKYGLYFLLSDIADAYKFIDNVNNTLNVKLKEQLDCSVLLWKQSDKEVVVRIPNKVWDNTYFVSLATLALRLCNYNIVYQSWEEMFSVTSPCTTVDNAIDALTREYACTNGFSLPDAVKDYWFYAGPQYNNKAPEENQTSHIIHNNGAKGWVTQMKLAGVI
jgi:hypothetical protein